jgi:hypothetical protein
MVVLICCISATTLFASPFGIFTGPSTCGGGTDGALFLRHFPPLQFEESQEDLDLSSVSLTSWLRVQFLEKVTPR